MEGEDKKVHHQTELKMSGEPSEANGTGKLSNQGRSGEEAARDTTNKQNKTKEKKYGTVFHFRWRFFAFFLFVFFSCCFLGFCFL